MCIWCLAMRSRSVIENKHEFQHLQGQEQGFHGQVATDSNEQPKVKQQRIHEPSYMKESTTDVELIEAVRAVRCQRVYIIEKIAEQQMSMIKHQTAIKPHIYFSLPCTSWKRPWLFVKQWQDLSHNVIAGQSMLHWICAQETLAKLLRL